MVAIGLAEILEPGAEKMGLPLTREALQCFEIYFAELEERNSVMNLTAISGEKYVAELHFLDSLGIFKAVGAGENGKTCFAGAKIIDIGSGGGFPGLPIKITEPSAQVTLLDGNQKKIDFLSGLCEKMGLYCECIAARAEEAGRDARYREGFDFAVSRAVARLNLLCELSLPFVRPGGFFLAMKSEESAGEADEAENALKMLGGALEDTVDYEIPGTGIVRRVVVVRKVSATPEKYPRRYARISGRPL